MPRILLFLPHLDVSGGLGVHCRMLLAALTSTPSRFQWTVAAPRNPATLFPGVTLERSDRLKTIDYRELDPPQEFHLADVLDPLLAPIIANVRPALIYGSYYTGLRRPGVPQVVTFHDAGFLENPAGFGTVAERRRQSIEAIRPALTHIHCISADARDRICRLLPWDPARTTVVWHALPDSPTVLADVRASDPAAVSLGSCRLKDWSPYFFLPVGAGTGFNRKRKNVPTAIRAFRQLDISARLIVAGTVTLTDTVLGELLPPEETGSVRDGCWCAADERVLVLPSLPRKLFLRAMRHAVGVIYPSRYEGFGLPTLEAMALGVPLIVSRAACMPEIVGDAAILVDPDDVPGFTAAMRTLARDASARDDLIHHGEARVRLFSHERLGRQMVDLFEKALTEAATAAMP